MENSLLKMAKKKYIPIVTRKETSKVFVDEILYIEKRLRIINIYTENKIYSVYGKMKEIEIYLDDSFYKCHKSCILNFSKIISMENGIFFFENGIDLRVGQNNYQYAKSKYKSFIIKKCFEKD